MRKISTRPSFLSRWLFPVFGFGFTLFFLLGVIFTGAFRDSFMLLVAPLVVAAGNFYFMKKLVWNLVDEVYDFGDFLLVRNQGDEDRVELKNILNVSVSTLWNWPRITLTLVTPGRFGKEVTFAPIGGPTFSPFSRTPLAQDLTARVEQEREVHHS